ncbi:MAG: RIP metalloprotease RseP [Candidatus Paceibacterota bacterium]|jgi:regulator of sigma E protease
MAFIIFVIVLGVLVFVHELGHFLVAKKAGVRVEEFGFGYPPRALKLGTKWGTLFSLNWIPFGGFVKIFGENYEEETTLNKSLRSKDATHTSLQDYSESPQEHSLPQEIGKNFTQVSKKWQASILTAGVVFNIIFAWLLFSLGFMIGLPTSVENDFGAVVKNPSLTVTALVSDYPAQKSGLKTGDKIKSISLENGTTLSELSPESTSNFINKSSGQIILEIDRGGKNFNFKITPKTEETNPSKEVRKIIGINMDMIGTLSLPVHQAFYQGGKTTLRLSYLTVMGLGDLVGNVFKGKADISGVAGPVGIIGLVGDASRLGFAYLLTFTALISINLAIINLVPFPALDGGRILFVAIEGITRKKINAKVAGVLNNVGFALLIIVMLIVTYRDILRLF